MKTTIRALPLWAVILAVMVPLAAQAVAPADSPQAFVTNAAQAGLAEVAAAKLAATSGQSAAVKSFAARMIADHGKANAELTAIATSKNLTVPSKPDDKHIRMMQALISKNGIDFDALYARDMVADHIAAVALFEANTTNQDAQLAAFASKTLPVLREHKLLADKLLADQKK